MSNKFDEIDDLYDEEEDGSTEGGSTIEKSDENFDSLYDEDEEEDKNKGGDGGAGDGTTDPPEETEEEKTAREEQESADAEEAERVAGLTDEEKEAERVAALSEEEVEAERREALTEEERAAEDAEIERRAALTDEEREAEDAEAAEEAAENPTNSVVEKFLEKFGVQGGVIEFEDGNSDHISSFDEETQLNILDEIVKQTQTSVEDKFGLSKDEVDVVNRLRAEDGPTIEEVVEAMVQERVSSIQESSQFDGEVDYEGMSHDDIQTMYLKDSLEEGETLSDEELVEELEILKGSKSYKKNTEAIREKYINSRESKRTEWKNERKESFRKEKDNEIQKIVDNVRPIDNVAGWKVDDNIKNQIIADLVELDDNGSSAFTREIMNNPQKMFEAQWYMRYGADYFGKMDTYYKGEIEKARELGKKEAAAKKTAAPKVSASKVGGKKPAGKKPVAKPTSQFEKKTSKVDSFDEFYD